MPIYGFACDSCGWQIETARNIAHRDAETICRCGERMRRAVELERPNVNPDWEPYADPNLIPMHATGAQIVESRGHRRELMKRLGVVECG